MNYLEEQQSELEAIEAIYPNEFNLLSDSPLTFTVSIKSETYEEGGDEGLFCTLKFAFTPKYPEEIPEIEILEEDEDDTNTTTELTNLEPTDVLDLKELLSQQANENKGMAMIFVIVSAAIEWMNNRWDFIIKEREDEAERKRIEEEEAEHKRFEGTRVTVQTFIAWKIAFDAELAAAKKAKQASTKEKTTDVIKLTGKELFMKDKSLIDSDLKFTDDDDEAGPIDESLFEDLEDLELENSDED